MYAPSSSQLHIRHTQRTTQSASKNQRDTVSYLDRLPFVSPICLLFYTLPTSHPAQSSAKPRRLITTMKHERNL
jgi:hypothetical protein